MGRISTLAPGSIFDRSRTFILKQAHRQINGFFDDALIGQERGSNIRAGDTFPFISANEKIELPKAKLRNAIFSLNFFRQFITAMLAGKKNVERLTEFDSYINKKPEIEKQKRYSYLRIINREAYAYFVEATRLLSEIT